MEIHIDEREGALYDCITRLATTANPKPTLVRRVLPLGDILLVQDGETRIIYERKTLQDLLASILDGRYSEQAHRLLGSADVPPHNVVYLIEGMMTSITGEDRKRRVYSAMASVHYFKGMSVMRTLSMEETAVLLLRTAEKLVRGPSGGAGAGEGANEAAKYAHVVGGANKVKRANITQENIGEIMLCQVPGISAVSARAIMAHFGGSLPALLRSLEADPASLDEIRYETGGKKRRIARTCGENLRAFLLPPAAVATPEPVV